jgi:hypothetical protein
MRKREVIEFRKVPNKVEADPFVAGAGNILHVDNCEI